MLRVYGSCLSRVGNSEFTPPSCHIFREVDWFQLSLDVMDIPKNRKEFAVLLGELISKGLSFVLCPVSKRIIIRD